ncbi:transmembrane amino acid transporter protein-domain-containing protein [Aspergillus stella-maris]|uniref:transmembrane amino acid transporter protein-domain-containing protein n=1 Tax=Aspergillus stella-maris TaxID=1810926 RepID=UPI003CCD4D1F
MAADVSATTAPNMNLKDNDHGEASHAETVARDDVFGDITKEGPNFRNVGFVGTIILMMKTQIGLGVLAIPSALCVLGMVPGIICLLAVAVITTWSGYMIGAFKLRHREVYSIDDAGGIMFGLPGRIVLFTGFCLYYVFNSGSAILGIAIGLNAVSTHATCTAVFVAVAAIVGFILASIRTLGKITWLAWIGLPCILAAVIMVTIGVGVQDRPAAAPQTDEPWVSDWRVAGSPSFAEAIAAVSNLLYAFSGIPGFFSIVSEMRDPKKYTAAMVICQGGVTVVYGVIGCVVYYYCGSYVVSPALGSAGGAIKIISYAFALPGLLVTMTIVTHIPAKFIFVHILRGSRHLTSNTPTHWLTWLGCTFGITLIAWIIASTIPVFDSLVSLIGALLGPVMCVQPIGAMWLNDNWWKGKDQDEGTETNSTQGAKGKTWKWMLLATWSVFLIILGTFLMIAGTYGSMRGIMSAYAEAGGSAAFSCKDNSNSG